MKNKSIKESTEQIDKDFERNLWCILGLPFDAINMQQAVEAVCLASIEKKPCFISTPNLNFLCLTQTDTDFRQSVINSDLSTADGMPIVALAKLLDIPLSERVTGSDLINALVERKTKQPIKSFFFGGEKGVAEQASLKLNQLNSGLVSVGHYDPGMVSVEEMSSDEIIAEINRYDIDFLIVSLGAKKGQCWIERNRDKLNAPIISHLGAVVNFSAGTVKRAPIWMRRNGLEWLWRIYQEPKLWKRYFDDGSRLLIMLVLHIIPYILWLKFNKSYLSVEAPVEVTLKSKDEDNSTYILITGVCYKQNNQPLRTVFKQALLTDKDVVIDLTSVTSIDGAFIGLCLLLQKHLNINDKTLCLINANTDIRKIIRWNRVEYLLV